MYSNEFIINVHLLSDFYFDSISLDVLISCDTSHDKYSEFIMYVDGFFFLHLLQSSKRHQKYKITDTNPNGSVV